MNSAEVHEQITEQLVQQLDESTHLHYPLMDRIEGRVRTKDQLEQYISVLVQKLEDRRFRDEGLVDRIDRLLMLHERLDRYERSGATTPGEYLDAISR